MEVKFLSGSPEQTEFFAKKIGHNLRGGECIEFISDLGGGKTTFVRGLAEGAGSTDSVSSPTFTISQQYNTNKFIIYHFDFYRLSEAGLVAEELSEVIGGNNNVVVVEWADTVKKVLPDERVIITIEKDPADDLKRIYLLNIPIDLRYLIDGIEV